MRDLTFYRFRSEWILGRSRKTVFEVLRDLEGYVAWWPEIREVHKIGEGRFDVTARALLPYELRMVLSQSVLDEDTGVIEADLSGHLIGFSR